MHLSPALSLGSKSFVTGLWLYEQVSSIVFGCWWAVPRVCQNSFKSGVFWCLIPLMMCGVITSLLQAAPSIFALPLSLFLHLSVLINASAVREGGRRGGGTTSQYKVAFKITPLKVIPTWRHQGWAVLYQRCQLGACTSHWICDGIIFPKTHLQHLFLA